MHVVEHHGGTPPNFGSSSSLPPFVSEGGGLVCESVGKADLLSDHFDSKKSREAVDLPLTCHLSPSLTAFAFMSSEVRRLLLEEEKTYLLGQWDPYGDTDPKGMFSLLLKRTADVMTPRLSVMFRRLARLGSFPALLYAGQCHSNSILKVLCCLWQPLLPITD